MSSTDRNTLSGLLRAALSITITSFLIVFLLKWLRILPIVDEKIYDLFSRARHSTRISSIITVNADRERAPSLQRLLKYLEKADAAAIGIDSALLKSALRDKRNRKNTLLPGSRGIQNLPDLYGDKEILSLILNNDKTVLTCEITRKDENDPSYQVKSAIPPLRRINIREGFISVVPDSDSIVRTTLLRVPIDEGTMPSFAFQLFGLYLAQKGEASSVIESGDSLTVGGRVIPLEPGSQRWGDIMRINYAGAEHFRPMSSETFTSPPAEFYKGSVILLLDPETSKRFNTPVGRLSAMLIEAEALNTLIEGKTWRRVPTSFSVGILLLICPISVLLVLRIRKISTSVLIIAGAMALYFIISFVLFIGCSMLIEMFMPFLAAVVSLASAVIYRMNTAEKMLEIKTGTITDGASYSTAGIPSEEQSRIKSGTPVFHADLYDSKAQTPSSLISLSDFKNDEVIGKYRILDRIGSGGMGEVFLVQHLNLNVRRAIKVIKPEILTKTGMRERFRHEAEAVARLNNPHIITVHDYEEIHGIPCIEMEYFESRSLRSEMKRGVPLKAQRVLQIVDNITCGLEAAHKASPVPMIHRDLKPENVLVSLNDLTLLKIIDFGLVKVLSGELELTSTSVPMGTPYYMAPEQINAGQIGPATDIYALGVILFEMVTGKKPFEKDSYIEILNQHLKSPVPSAYALNSSYPETIDAVISKAMEKDPLNRFSDAREFYRELLQVLGDVGDSPSDDPLAKTL